MLGSIRKFSSSIYAKILLGIIIIPFVFWGMGSSITGGSKNVIVIIDKEKFTTQQFNDFLNKNAPSKIKANEVENYLASFIGEKLIEKEIENFGIKLSDKSLKKLIVNQENFKRENKFSRTEYEKFLLENNITAVNFEFILSKEEKKRQFFDLIRGGIYPPKFLVNMSYDQVNQKRNIELINLNEAFKENLNFSEKDIKDYFIQNIDKFSQIYKNIKLIELSPQKLLDNEEYSDLFFKKIDEIEDLVIQGVQLDSIATKLNLGNALSYKINIIGENANQSSNSNISKNLAEKIFIHDESDPTAIFEVENKYFLINIIKSEKIKMNINKKQVKEKIIVDLKKTVNRKLISELIDKINKNTFNKLDFDKLAKDKNIVVKKIKLLNRNDELSLKKEIVNQIYMYPEKKVFAVNEISFLENYLVYIDKIENVNINKNDGQYMEYLNLSRSKIISQIYNTYDNYIKKRYEIDINYQTLNVIKNYFN